VGAETGECFTDSLERFSKVSYLNIVRHVVNIYFDDINISDKGISVVLMQEHSDSKMSITYASSKIIAYSTIEKECIAIVREIQKYLRYLYVHKFTLKTNH
jgi:D-Tyr-tRNAtyr deacylase